MNIPFVSDDDLETVVCKEKRSLLPHYIKSIVPYILYSVLKTLIGFN